MQGDTNLPMKAAMSGLHTWLNKNTTQEPALLANGARHLAARFLLRSPSSLDKILP